MTRFSGLIVLSAVLALGVTGTAQAQRVSKINGKALGAICSGTKTLGICDAYLAGVMDSTVWAKDYDNYAKDKTAPVAFCVPESQKAPQVRGIVLAWLHAHEDALSEPAGKGVYRALHENYPCHSSPEGQK